MEMSDYRASWTANAVSEKTDDQIMALGIEVWYEITHLWGAERFSRKRSAQVTSDGRLNLHRSWHMGAASAL